MLGGLWSGVPRRVRVIAALMVAVLAYGTIVHIVQLVAGWPRPYPWAPAWLEAYFISLTLADALAAILTAARRLRGLQLAVLVLVTDAIANGYAVYGLGPPSAVAQVGQAVVSLLAIASLIAYPLIRPYLRPAQPPRASAGGVSG